MDSAAEDQYDGPTIIPVLQVLQVPQTHDDEPARPSWNPAPADTSHQPDQPDEAQPSTASVEPVEASDKSEASEWADTNAYIPPSDETHEETTAEALVDMPTELAAEPSEPSEHAEAIDSVDTIAYTPPSEPDQPTAVAETPVDMPTEVATAPSAPVEPLEEMPTYMPTEIAPAPAEAMPAEAIETAETLPAMSPALVFEEAPTELVAVSPALEETPAESPAYMPTEMAAMSPNIDLAETMPAAPPVSDETPTELVAASDVPEEAAVAMPTELAQEPPAYTAPAYTPPEPPTYVPPTYTPPSYTPPEPPAYTPPVYSPPVYSPPASPVYSPPPPAAASDVPDVSDVSPAADQLVKTVAYAPMAELPQPPAGNTPPEAPMEPPDYTPPAYSPLEPEQPPAYMPPVYTPPAHEPPRSAQTYSPPQQPAYRATPQPWSGQSTPPPKKRGAGRAIGCLALLVLVVALAIAGVFYVRSQPNGVALGGVTIGGPSTAPGVIYQDALDGSTKSHWTNDSNCFFGSGGYHINAGFICYAPADTAGDAVTTVTAKQISGPITYGYGLVIRRTSKGNYYEFEIDANGKWRFSKVVNGTVTDIVSFASNDAVKKGLNQVNTISVQAKGSHFVFSVNGKQVGTADDSTFASGDTGLVGYNGIEIVFTNLSIAKV